ncbi:deaminase [Desulfosporosinus sp. FKA]|uniref:deaminase n=1 Tax=Desulfosporosinus sp. FKA TaxID=1969834 RepID=UPI00155200ED|nr:deaminase [Desulfosporosinus sp. FKA]
MEIPFLILGFTGPIGAGCTTLAKIITRTNPSVLVKRKQFYENVIKNMENISDQMKEATCELELENYSKQLRELYHQRAYLRVLHQVKDPRFVYVSMSAIILKLVIETSYAQEFNKWSEAFPQLSEIIMEFRKKWIEIIHIYNISDKKFEKLSDSELNSIDEMFKDLDNIRKEITDIELGDFFNNRIDELHLQIFGNNIRKTGSAFISDDSKGDLENLPLIAIEVNRYIKYYRNRADSKKANCFVVDAFRNPAEVEFFRRYDQFFLISLYASEKTRQERLGSTILGGSFHKREDFADIFKKINERDWGDDSNIKDLHKQNVSRCFYLADIAINNDKSNEEFDMKLFDKFLRYYALIASPGCVQPTKEETFMNLAYSLSLRSSCISRKVGAVITDKAGFVLGVGWNDVAHGQIGCGLRQKEDFLKEENELFSMELFKGLLTNEDFEQFSEYDSICFKDVLSEKKIKEKLAKTDMSQTEKEKVLQVLKIKRLEYCRSLHAEENALLQVATRGGMGVHGGEIYTTTFPCELCAKKINQSGITTVYYTEPYPNSISERLFLKDGIRRIEIRQFEGVKSFSYFKLYKPLYDKKEAQKIDDLV